MAATPSDPIEALNAKAEELGWPTRCDPTMSFVNPQLIQLVESWNRARGQRAMPLRSELTARALKTNLRRVLLFEREMGPSGRRYRIRLMGTGLAQIWGDLTGKFVDEAIPRKLSPRWHAFIDTVLEVSHPLRFVARVDFQQKAFLVAEIAAAPLADDSGEPGMVMALINVSNEKPWEDIVTDLADKVPEWKGTARAGLSIA